MVARFSARLSRALNSVFRGRASLGPELIALHINWLSRSHNAEDGLGCRRRSTGCCGCGTHALEIDRRYRTCGRWFSALCAWILSNSIIALRVELRNTDAIELGLMN